VANPKSMMLFIGRNGPVPVGGSTDITILTSILHGSKSLSEIFNTSDLAKSTVFSSLKRLSESGLLCSEGSGNEKKYSLCAVPVFRTCDPEDESPESFFEACLLPSTKGFYRNMFYYMIMIATQNGISLQPMLTNYALLLGNVAYSIIGHPTADVGLRNLVDYLTESDAGDMEVKEMIPLHIGISVMPELTSRAADTYVEFISTIVARFVSLCAEATYVIEKIENKGNNVFDIRFTPSKIPYPQAYGVIPLSSIEIEPDENVLSVYRTKSGFQLLSDPVQASVMSVIRTKVASAKELSEILGLDIKTVSSTLNKLNSMELISISQSPSRTAYRSRNRPLIVWDSAEHSEPIRIDLDLKKAFLEKDYFFYYVVSYMIARVGSTGADITGMLFSFATHTAEHMLSKLETPTMKSAIQMLDCCSFRKIYVESFMPFSAVTVSDHDIDADIALHLAHFDTMFLGKLIESITGHMHSVTESRIYGEGNRYHAFTIKPVN